MRSIAIISVFLAIQFIPATLNGQSDPKMLYAFSESYKAELAGNYAVAVSEIRSIYQAGSYPMNARLGWLLFLSKQYTESVGFYEKAIKLKPDCLESRFGLIKAHNALENWGKVKEQYEAILKIDSQNTTALYWLGVLLYNRKDYEGAAKNFERIVNLYPMDYGSVIMLAWSRFYQTRMTEARDLFNLALLLSPNDASANSGLSQIK
jgi:tetratricopeptide (TPR) repeat protein